MQDISCLVLPIPAHAFFKQAVLQGEIGHHLLQGGGFTTKVLHLAGRRGAGGVARQPALAGLQELLRPPVIHRGGNAFPAAQLRDVLLAAQSFQHNADLLFGRILLPRRPADVADKLLGRTSGGNGFLSHLRSLAATMSQKSSAPQAAKFVSQALKRDTLYMRKYNAGGGPIRENFAREISIRGGCRPCTVPEDDLLLGLRAWRVSDTRRAGPPLHALRVC